MRLDELGQAFVVRLVMRPQQPSPRLSLYSLLNSIYLNKS